MAKRLTDKREPRIGERFRWQGIKLRTVICKGKGCTNCFFNYSRSENRSQGCIDHICEGRLRMDDTAVKFVKAK